MEKITVQFTRIFDSVPAGRHGEDSQFGFETSGKREFAVTAPGHPRIEAGMTITALLRKPGNWKTLWGWVDHESGEIAIPRMPVATGVFTALFSLYLPIVIVMSNLNKMSWALLPLVAASMAVFLFCVMRTLADWRMKKALYEIAAEVATMRRPPL